MKKLLVLITTILIFLNTHAQGNFNKELDSLNSDLSSKLKLLGKRRVVVLYINYIDKSSTIAGKYLADQVSTNLVKNPGVFSVFDRDNLTEIDAVKKLISQGYLNDTTAKNLGKVLSVDAIITGTYTVLSKSLFLSLKIIDSESGFMVSSSARNIPLDADAASVLGINFSDNNTDNNIADRGFNRSVNSNEHENNPSSVNKDCASQNTGDYCFTNNSNKKVIVNIMVGVYYGTSQEFKQRKSITLEPKQTQCFYDLQAKAIEYSILDNSAPPPPSGYHSTSGNDTPEIANGQIQVEKCKSKTFIIK